MAAGRSSTDCESVQFVSGLSVEAGRAGDAAERLVLAYNVNDCETKLGFLATQQVWRMLRPLQEDGSVCVFESQK